MRSKWRERQGRGGGKLIWATGEALVEPGEGTSLPLTLRGDGAAPVSPRERRRGGPHVRPLHCSSLGNCFGGEQ